MTPSLPQWMSRLAAVALLIGILGGAYLFIVSPLIAAYRDTDRAISQASEMLQRYQRIARTRAALEARLEKLTRRQQSSGIYLRGDTDALAAAELQDSATTTIEANGGRVRSIQTLQPRNEDDFVRVSVRVQFTASIESLQRVLYALESGKPFLFITNLDVRSRLKRRGQTREAADPTLAVRFDVSGYLRPELA